MTVFSPIAPALARARRGLCVTLAICLAGAAAAVPPSREYDLKAAFLYNFVTFVEWPKDALPEGKPLVIGILGQDPFGATLDEIVAGEKVRQSPLEVRRCRSVEEARQCHIVFISASEAARLPAIMQELRTRPVLTVADMAHFLDAGGIIAFTTDGRVQLHISPAAARRAGLSISSKLLRVAKVVEETVP